MGETLRTVFMGATSLIAALSFFSTVRLWRKTNRPIVSAFVETSSAGNVATMYSLLLINSGNRPAVNVQLSLKIDISDFKNCITREIEDPNVEAILKCFSKEAIIPLLIDGNKTSNYFGITSTKEMDNIWVYGSSLPVEIRYQDLEGNKYTSTLSLVVKYSKAFAGMEWTEKEYKKEDIAKLLQQILDSVKE